RLIGFLYALRVGFEVNQDPPLGGDIARLGVEFKVVSGNAVEAARVLAVDNDLDVVQFSVPAFFELDRLRCANREFRASLLGLGDRKTLGSLLDVEPDFRRNFVHGPAYAPARIEIHPRHDRDHQDRSRSKPAAKAGHRKRHDFFSLKESERGDCGRAYPIAEVRGQIAEVKSPCVPAPTISVLTSAI